MPIILLGDEAGIYQEIGHAIARAIKELKREAVILASGDMSHYETAEAARKNDMQAVEAMLALDADELTRRYKNLHITMCAHGPVVTLITAAKDLGAKSAELVKYQNSGDASGDYSSVVAYAGVIFRKGGK